MYKRQALTKINTPTIEGTAEAGSTVELFNGSDSLGTVIAADNGTFSITSSVLPDDIYTLTVRATDLAGNVSAESVGLPIEIDTTAPAAPLITTDIALTKINTPTIEGTAEAGSTVELLNGNNVLGSVIAGNDGSFSITPSELDDANYTLTVTATDEAGNTSEPSTDPTASNVAITGAAGAVVSIVIDSPADGSDVFPASSVAVTVNE